MHTKPVRTAVACVIAALAVAAVSCAGDRSDKPGESEQQSRLPTTTQECSSQVRLGSVVYTSYGCTDRRPAAEFGTADEADCHDVGPNARGSVFSDNPRQVAVWSFHGYAPGMVVGVRFDKDSFAVFVAESVAARDRERIFRELG